VEHRRFILIGAVVLALILVSSLFSVLGTRASEDLLQSHQNTVGSADPLPDLIVSRVDALTVTATRLDYRFVIQNVGVITADLDGVLPDTSDDVLVQTILSEDTTYGNTGDRATGGFNMSHYVTELGPGEEFTHTYYANPADVYFFDYNYFMVMIDSSEELDEIDENNNVGYVGLPDGPDLIVPSVDVLNINDNGVVYKFEVQNIGDGTADLDGPDDGTPMDNVNFQGYLSVNDTLWDGDDVPAGGGSILSPTELLPGEVFTYTMTAGMSGSNYLDYRYIFVVIDLVDNLPETDEDNNEGMGEIPYFIYLPQILR
jgi:hypothetical protein